MAQVGRKTRPVLILTRTEVIDVRQHVTVAEVTTSARGLAAEIKFDHDTAGLDKASVINADGLHTVARSALTGPVGIVDDAIMDEVCWAIRYAFAC